MKGTSPTQRTLAALREDGWIVAIVEHWNQFAHIRQDLFGFADIIAFRCGNVLLVQCTDGTSVSKRIEKIRASDIAKAWAEDAATRSIEVWGWSKLGLRGERKSWTARRVRMLTVRGLNGLQWIVTEASETATINAAPAA